MTKAPIVSTDDNLVVRTARKRWRCICADPHRGRVNTGYANPNYRPGCIGDILPGDLYVEYTGEADPFSHGSAYCVPCAVGAWPDDVTAAAGAVDAAIQTALERATLKALDRERAR